MRFLFLALCLCPVALRAEVPRVATDIAPVHSIVAKVMEGVGVPSLIIPPGASPHGYAMRPSEARALGQADLVVWVGPALTPWLEEPIETLAGDAENLPLLDQKAVRLLSLRDGVAFAEDHHDHDGDHDHDDDHGEEHGDDDHAADPHAWLDPGNGAVWAAVVADRLAAMDPDNADTYRANAAALRTEVEAFDARWAPQFHPLEQAGFIVFHDAFQYFEAHFHLSSTAAIQLSDAAKPGAGRVADLKDLLTERPITCAFAEPQFDPRMIATVTEGLSVKTAVLDPLGGDVPLGPDHYIGMLDTLAAAMVGCLSPQ